WGCSSLWLGPLASLIRPRRAQRAPGPPGYPSCAAPRRKGFGAYTAASRARARAASSRPKSRRAMSQKATWPPGAALMITRLRMIPPSQAATTYGAKRGSRNTITPAAISMTPTAYMKCKDDTCPKKCGKPAHRYLGQNVIQLKNLSMPNSIGATVNAIHRSRKAWNAGLRTSPRSGPKRPAMIGRPATRLACLDGACLKPASGASRQNRPPAAHRPRLTGRACRELPGHLRETLGYCAWRAQRYVCPVGPAGRQPAGDHRAVVAYPPVIGVGVGAGAFAGPLRP